MNLFWRAFLVFVLVTVLALAGTADFGVVQVSAEAPGVIVIISSDTTWTKADSPHTLTGPLLVNQEVTLTIEAGATVNLNGYEIRVNGTLRAIGTSTDQIHFKNGIITFTEFSNGWDEQTNSGSLIEYAVFNSVLVSSSVSLMINNCEVDGELSLGGSSVILNSTISNGVTIAGSCEILYNTIHGGVEIAYSRKSTISGNTIFASSESPAISINQGSSVISNNTIRGGGTVYYPLSLEGTLIYAVVITSGISEISNNKIDGGLSAGKSSSISSNVIEGQVLVNDGSPIISNNTIDGGIAVGLSSNYKVEAPQILNNTIDGYIGVHDGSPRIMSNTVIGNYANLGIGFHDDYAGKGAIVSENFIANCCYGATFWGTAGAVTFEQNSIINSTYGIIISGGSVTVRNNSLTSNTFGIYLDDSATVASIIYNNIQDSKQNNLVLDDVPTNVNAAYNWWGTTDNQAINQTIYDYKNDFYLGNVNYVPLLTQPNPEAPSTQITVIPEFPAWILLPLFFVATFVVLVVRRRLVC